MVLRASTHALTHAGSAPSVKHRVTLSPEDVRLIATLRAPDEAQVYLCG
jgi:hypothetical protein